MLERAEKEDRIILTRNHCLKRLSEGKKSLFITNDQPWNQLREVMRAYHIKKSEEAFSRCILCNHPLQRIVKSEVEDKVPEYVYNTQKNFFTCPQCYRIFWPGTHHRRMEEKIDTL